MKNRDDQADKYEAEHVVDNVRPVDADDDGRHCRCRDGTGSVLAFGCEKRGVRSFWDLHVKAIRT